MALISSVGMRAGQKHAIDGEREVYSIAESHSWLKARGMRISRTIMYDAVRSGEIPSFKRFNRTWISRQSLIGVLNGQQ